MFTKQHQLGILLGIAAGILFASLLNWSFGWIVSAMTWGLVVGLEMGFWVGVPVLTKSVHQRIFQTIFLKTFSRGTLRNLFTLGKIVTLSLITITTICLSFWLAWKMSVFLEDITPPLLLNVYNSYLVPFSPQNIFTHINLSDAVRQMSFFSVGIVIIIFLFSLYKMDELSYHLTKIGIIFSLSSIPAAIVISSLVYFLSVIMVLLLLTLLWLFVTLIIFLCAVCMVALILYGLANIASKHEASTITIGVVSGVLSGLGFGLWWTDFAFFPTILSLLAGCIVGYGLAYIFYRIGIAEWFKKIQAEFSEKKDSSSAEPTKG